MHFKQWIVLLGLIMLCVQNTEPKTSERVKMLKVINNVPTERAYTTFC